MKIVGCDLHTRYQQIAMLDQETGELIERRLEHESGEARAFYGGWPSLPMANHTVGAPSFAAFLRRVGGRLIAPWPSPFTPRVQLIPPRSSSLPSSTSGAPD